MARYGRMAAAKNGWSIRAAIAVAIKGRRAAAVTRTTGRPIDDLDALPAHRLFSAG
jgi:hypothetical protein